MSDYSDNAILVYRVANRGKRGPLLIQCRFIKEEAKVAGLPISITEWRIDRDFKTESGYPRTGDWPNLITCFTSYEYRMADNPADAWERYVKHMSQAETRAAHELYRLQKAHAASMMRWEKFKKEGVRL